MRDDPKRLLHAAQALAMVYGDKWEGLDAAAKAHYQKEAHAVVLALNTYDSAQRSRAIREGHAKSGRSRIRNGRPALESAKVQQVRDLLQKRYTSRIIREMTGLGNSTITRIRSEMERENGVPARSSASAHSATGDLQV